MQTVILSGDNLVTILDALHDGVWGLTARPNQANSARCRTLYGRFKDFLEDTDRPVDHSRHEALALSIDDRVVVEAQDAQPHGRGAAGSGGPPTMRRRLSAASWSSPVTAIWWGGIRLPMVTLC
ncbi:hypothetical protein [Embleya sp. NBC_00896]|uniref:hypothetical protein n=1 Tax=Embleya sp. NBC_00896 TaxID=2975961 RepID=UPI002F90CAAE|nr:hypothetical protein OG928_33090 [Embleya sp. NBC_00896]